MTPGRSRQRQWRSTLSDEHHSKGPSSSISKGLVIDEANPYKRYSTIKTCTQRAKQFATLTQKSGELVENFYDRTQMAMIIVQEKARAAIPVADVERLKGYNKSADGTQAMLFVACYLSLDCCHTSRPL
jgi:hypothetical protein